MLFISIERMKWEWGNKKEQKSHDTSFFLSRCSLLLPQMHVQVHSTVICRFLFCLFLQFTTIDSCFMAFQYRAIHTSLDIGAATKAMRSITLLFSTMKPSPTCMDCLPLAEKLDRHCSKCKMRTQTEFHSVFCFTWIRHFSLIPMYKTICKYLSIQRRIFFTARRFLDFKISSDRHNTAAWCWLKHFLCKQRQTLDWIFRTFALQRNEMRATSDDSEKQQS